jgi:dienelactone hydrolase
MPWQVAGVVYEPTAPLFPTLKPLFDPKDPPPARTYAVAFAGARGRVPGLLTLPQAPASARVPAALLLHGLGGGKQDLFVLQMALAQKGIASLAVDAAGHGARAQRALPIERLSLWQMRSLAAQTIVDLRRAVDFLSGRPGLDPARIGFSGISLGGILGAVLFGAEARVRCAALLAAGGDWPTLIGTSRIAVARQARSQRNYRAETVGQILGAVDPVAFIGRAAGRPLLLVTNTGDTIVPRASSDALFRAAAAPKRRVLLPGEHVSDPTRALGEAIGFLTECLRPTVSGPP